MKLDRQGGKDELGKMGNGKEYNQSILYEKYLNKKYG